MFHLGLTGGIGSGKTTVAEMFAALGAKVIDLDRLAHEVMDSDELLKLDLQGYFGPAVVNPDGTINRKHLAEIVFDSQEDLKALNEIVHPHITRKWQACLDEIQKSDPHALVVSDVPLLLEAGLTPLFDLVALVYVPREEQIRRLRKRNNISAAEAEKMLATQWPIEEKKGLVHLVIDNQGDISQTREFIYNLWEELQKHLARRAAGAGTPGKQDLS